METASLTAPFTETITGIDAGRNAASRDLALVSALRRSPPGANSSGIKGDRLRIPRPLGADLSPLGCDDTGYSEIVP